MKRLVILTLLALYCGIAGAPESRADADLKPAAFFGTYQGSGVSSNRDSIYFAVTPRTFDVVIRQAANGFEVSWTTLIRRGGDPDNPDERQKKATRRFVATSNPQIFRGADSADATAGGVQSWARIEGATLSVYEMRVLASGAYDVQKYDRTVTAEGMTLVYTRLRDGEPVRTVKGRLARTGN